jgi:hypothetical protein
MDIKFGMTTDDMRSNYFFMGDSFQVIGYINGDYKNIVVKSGRFRVCDIGKYMQILMSKKLKKKKKLNYPSNRGETSRIPNFSR